MKIFTAVLLLMVFAISAAAQEETPEATAEIVPLLTATFISDTEAVSFCYPSGWVIREQLSSNDTHFFGFIVDSEATFRSPYRQPGELMISVQIVEGDSAYLRAADVTSADALSVAQAFRQFYVNASVEAGNSAQIEFGEITTFPLDDRTGAQFFVHIHKGEDNPEAEAMIVFVEAEGLISIFSADSAPGTIGDWEGIVQAIAGSVHRVTSSPTAICN